MVPGVDELDGYLLSVLSDLCLARILDSICLLDPLCLLDTLRLEGLLDLTMAGVCHGLVGRVGGGVWRTYAPYS